MFLNQFNLIGRIGNFIETKQFNRDGKIYTLTRFSLVVNNPKSEDPHTFMIESWQPCCAWLQKGRLLLVTGQLASWHTETGRGITLKANTVRFLDRKPVPSDSELDYVDDNHDHFEDNHLDEIAPAPELVIA